MVGFCPGNDHSSTGFVYGWDESIRSWGDGGWFLRIRLRIRFSWVPGTSHTVSVASPQSGPSGTQYVYSSWSDGGGQSHSITAPSSSTTYTASFTTQYNLTTSANPSAGGSVVPQGATGTTAARWLLYRRQPMPDIALAVGPGILRVRRMPKVLR